MKKNLFTLICGFLSFISCSKLEVTDPADAFVGSYNVSVVENVIWEHDSATLNDNGMFIISKLSANRIQVSGFISTQGEVLGSSIYFEGHSSSDSVGQLTVSYGIGTLNGNILTFTANTTGQLAYQGVPYPFRSTSLFTAIRQN